MEPSDKTQPVYIWRTEERRGPIWRIQLGDQGPQMVVSGKGALDGLFFLSLILQAREPISSARLVARLEGSDATEREAIEREAAANSHQPVLDPEAQRRVRLRKAELQQEIEEAKAFGDDATMERAAKDLDDLLATVAATVGLFGRSRTFATPNRKHEQKVRKALKALQEACRKVGLDDLADHLKCSLKGGEKWVYFPSSPLLLINRPPEIADESESESARIAQFHKLLPRMHQPEWRAASEAQQLQLQALRPVDVEPLRRLLAAFGIDRREISIPIGEAAHKSLMGCHEQYGEIIARAVESGPSADQVSALRQAYDYLRCSDALADEAALRDIDVIIVPGARRSLSGRLGCAVEIFQNVAHDPYLILSGDRPHYDADNDWMTEADAMYYHIRHVMKVELPDERVILERRARSLRETAFFALALLQSISIERKRALNVCIITAPYALRRFWMIMAAQVDAFPQVVRNLSRKHGGTNLHVDSALNPQTKPKERQYAISYFVLEHLKLLGGRAVGEF